MAFTPKYPFRGATFLHNAQSTHRDTSAYEWGGQFTALTTPEGLSTAAASESSISSFANNFDTLLLMHWFPLDLEKKG